MSEVSSSTPIKIRCLKLKERRELIGILSVNNSWQELAGIIRNPDNKDEYLFTNDDISMLEAQWKAGRSPAEALLEHWSTSGREQPNLTDLLKYLKEAKLLRAAHYVQTELLKIPDHTVESDTISETLETVLHAPGQNGGCYEQEISNIEKALQDIDIGDLKVFCYDELAKATKNFCDTRLESGGSKIGEGSFGSVYLATLGGVKVAVKKLKDSIDKQFYTELKILIRFKHENLLPLLGCSINGPSCCLVYEYMANGSLQERLACIGNSSPIPSMTRISIAYGSALGINHLHTFEDEPMVHRDIKSANILLDEHFIPKVGDFGLVRIGSNNISSTTAVTQNVYGTCVYMAREAFNGDVSVKLDTFSFGVVLLELLTGLPPYDASREDRDLITFMENCEDILTMLDLKVQWKSKSATELYRIAKCCLAGAKKNRPTIAEILDELKMCLLHGY